MGLCHEFGSQINAGCDHPMRAGASACSCPECGVVCQGLFDGCADVWARGPRPVSISATRAVAARALASAAPPPSPPPPPAAPVTPQAGASPTLTAPAAAAPPGPGPGRGPGEDEPSERRLTLAPAGARRGNGNRGGNRARVQAAASYGKTDLPAPEPAVAEPRREMFRWFEEAFVGVRSDLQTLIASMTHQQAMLAELIDSRQAELRLVLAAETLPDIVAEAVTSAVGAHTAAMTESFTTALGMFREEMDKAQAGTAATVDSLRDSFDMFLNALAVQDERVEKREAARLRTLKGSITRQMAPLAEAVALLNAQAEGPRPARRPPVAAAAKTEPEPRPSAPSARKPEPVPDVESAAAGAAAPARRTPRVVTGPQVAQPRSPRVVTGPQVKTAQARPSSPSAAPPRAPRVVTGPGVARTAKAPAPAPAPSPARRPPASQGGATPRAAAEKSPLLRTIRGSRSKP